MNDKGVNSEAYWEGRFREDWDSKNGDKQSTFFGDVAVGLLPGWFKNYLKDESPTFLDWGCAEGEGTNVLHKKFPNVKMTGIDFSDTAIKNANTRFNGIDFQAVDLLTAKKHQEKYDVVFLSNVLEHFHDPWKTFESISKYANRFVVAMTPFSEPVKNRTPEHFYSFTPETIPTRIGEWSLVFVAVKNTAAMRGTRWDGEQVMMIFANNGDLKDLNLSAADMNLSFSDDAHVAAEHKALEDNIVTMQEQLDEYWKVVDSSRLRAINRVMSIADRVLPLKRVKRSVGKLKQLRRSPREKLDMYRLRRVAMKHKGVIVHTGIPWDEVLRQRPHHISPRLAAGGYFFVYVDPEAEPGLRRWVSDDLLVVSGYDVLDKLAGLRKKLPLYYISIAGFPSTFDELAAIRAKGYKIVYEYIDELDESINGNLKKQIGVYKRLEELEPSLVITSAKRLFNEMAKRFPKNRILLSQNAVDIEKFRPHERHVDEAPEDIQGIIREGKPIVGYYGAIASWLDYSLINSMVLERPDYNFVFIGRDYDDGLKSLHLPKNMHYLGPKNYEDLAEYSYWFDCAIIPFQNGEIAKSTSPLKLFEYMAMGLPTVCTKDLRECRGYDGVLMSNDSKQFIKNVDRAIKLKQDKKTRDKLVRSAKANTWDARADDILKALKKAER